MSYSCGHVAVTPNVCLRDIDPHFRCEPRGCKITQPTSRCVECFSRDVLPEQHLTTTVRFNPAPNQPGVGERKIAENRLSGENTKQYNAIRRWIMAISSRASLKGQSDQSYQEWARTYAATSPPTLKASPHDSHHPELQECHDIRATDKAND